MIEKLMFILPLIIAGIVFGGVVFLLARHPPKKMIKDIREFTGMLNRKSRKLGLIKRMDVFLIKNGAGYHLGKGIDAIKLLAISILLFAVGFFVGQKINIFLGLPTAIVLSIGIWLIIPILNRGDNEKMLTDLKMIYHALAMQIKAGVYVTDALSECYSCVYSERLRDALLDLGGDIVMKAELFGALERFQGKFDNRYIDSLCITVLQSMESGQATNLLSDLAEQIRDMEKNVLEKKKGRLDRWLTFYQLGMLACILAVALYACVSYMLVAATNI